MLKFISSVISVVMLSGCVNMLTPLGKDKYDCNRKENPTSPYCHSFKSVETASNDELPDSRYDQTVTLSEFDKLTGVAPEPKSVTAGGNQVQSSSTGKTSLALPHQSRNQQDLTGVPVRMAPVIQRIWIKRFVDANDSITSDLVVYREVIPAHWSGFAPGSQSALSSVGKFPFRSVDKPVNTQQTSNDVNKEFSQPGVPDAGPEVPAQRTGINLPK